MMRRFSLYYTLLLVVFLFGHGSVVAKKAAPVFSGGNEEEIMAIATFSDINKLLNAVSLYVLLEIDVSKEIVFRDKDLVAFGNYLDYQVVGAGKTAYIYPGKIASFIVEQINAGIAVQDIARLVINAFQTGAFSVEIAGETDTKSGAKLTIGAYLVAGYEVYQQPEDGEFLRHFEINQSKFYFSGRFHPNNSNTNVVDFLGEFNPVAEDLHHHIEFLRINHNGHIDTLEHEEQELLEGTVPFERLQVTVSNIAKTGIRATLGQVRNPFGNWSDFSSYRNLSSTKNNLLVNGFALKKIDLGLQLEREFGAFGVTAALLSGHKGRTYEIPREFTQARPDVVLRGTWQNRGLRLGATAYLSEFNTESTAYGVDASLEADRFLFGAEMVYQRNTNFGEDVNSHIEYETASSVSGYVQVDYAIRPLLHVYGLYDGWALYLDGDLVRHPVYHIAHGIRYYLTQNVRFTILEYARLTHQGFDRSKDSYVTRIEVTF